MPDSTSKISLLTSSSTQTPHTIPFLWQQTLWRLIQGTQVSMPPWIKVFAAVHSQGWHSKPVLNSGHFTSSGLLSPLLLSSPRLIIPLCSAPVLQTICLLLGCSKLESLRVTCSFPSPTAVKYRAKQQKRCCNTTA